MTTLHGRSHRTVLTGVLMAGLVSTLACAPFRRGAQAVQPSSQSTPVARSFANLQPRMGRGDKLWLRDQANREIPGRLVSVSPFTLVLDLESGPRTFAEAEVRLIRQRRSDPLWNGIAIGAALGFAIGVIGEAAEGCY